MLAAARELATAHGYEQLRVGELADAAGVSRETFYTHFADKRACLAEATAPRLGEVEQLLRIATEEGEEEWAKPLIAGVDEQLSRRFDSEQADGDVRPDTAGASLREGCPGSPRLRLLSGALVETMRERLLADELERMPAAVGTLLEILGDSEGQPAPRPKRSGPTESSSRRRTRRQRSRPRTAATAA